MNHSIINKQFSGIYVYPEWFNQKKLAFYFSMKRRIEKAIWIHLHSARYFEKLHFRLFAPSITITALSGIASFLSSSDVIDKTTQTSFAIGVGIMSSISAMIQSIVSSMKYSAKADSHRLAADEYTQLLTRVKFEIEMPNERNFGETLEKKILDIQHKCKYFPPQHIVESYPKTDLYDTDTSETFYKSSLPTHINTINNEQSHSDLHILNSTENTNLLHFEEQTTSKSRSSDIINANNPIDNPIDNPTNTIDNTKNTIDNTDIIDKFKDAVVIEYCEETQKIHTSI